MDFTRNINEENKIWNIDASQYWCIGSTWMWLKKNYSVQRPFCFNAIAQNINVNRCTQLYFFLLQFSGSRKPMTPKWQSRKYRTLSNLATVWYFVQNAILLNFRLTKHKSHSNFQIKMYILIEILLFKWNTIKPELFGCILQCTIFLINNPLFV